jgi:hypothetical protein
MLATNFVWQAPCLADLAKGGESQTVATARLAGYTRSKPSE